MPETLGRRATGSRVVIGGGYYQCVCGSESTADVSPVAAQLLDLLFVLLLSRLQLWIDSSSAGLPAAPEKKEADFFAEHTQVGCRQTTSL